MHEALSRIKMMFSAAQLSLDEKIGEAERALKHGELLRKKRELRTSEAYSFLSWQNFGLKCSDPSAQENVFADLEAAFPGLVLPSIYVEFMKWTDGFLSVHEGARRGFSASPFGLCGPSAALQAVYTHNLEIYCHRRKPLHFRRLLSLGACGRGELALWLLPHSACEGEVVLFDQKAANAYVIKDNFSIVSRSFSGFLQRILFCLQENVPLDLLSPGAREAEWLQDSKAVVWPLVSDEQTRFTFSEPWRFPAHWQLDDAEWELEQCLQHATSKFNVAFCDDAKRSFLRYHKKRYTV